MGHLRRKEKAEEDVARKRPKVDTAIAHMNQPEEGDIVENRLDNTAGTTKQSHNNPRVQQWVSSVSAALAM